MCNHYLDEVSLLYRCYTFGSMDYFIVPVVRVWVQMCNNYLDEVSLLCIDTTLLHSKIALYFLYNALSIFGYCVL